MENKKKIPSYTIDMIQEKDDKGNIKNKIVSIKEEEDSNPWHREVFDRKRDGLLVKEIITDMNNIALNLTNINEKGERIAKYDLWMKNLPANPKTSKGARRKYISYLKEYLEKEHEVEDLAKFINKEKFVYLIIYLGDKRYNSGNDSDNFAKTVLDALKLFIGDDEKR